MNSPVSSHLLCQPGLHQLQERNPNTAGWKAGGGVSLGSCPGNPAQTQHHHNRDVHSHSAASQVLKHTQVLHTVDFMPLNSVGMSAHLQAQLSALLCFLALNTR